MEFKVGDIVEWCGAIGKVMIDDNTQSLSRPICCQFGEPSRCFYFTADGKAFPWHKEPSLKLIHGGAIEQLSREPIGS